MFIPIKDGVRNSYVFWMVFWSINVIYRKLEQYEHWNI